MGEERWQPIDAAPINKRVLVFVPIEHHRLVIATKTDAGLWLREDHQPMSYPPSHWMPLPDPPISCKNASIPLGAASQLSELLHEQGRAVVSRRLQATCITICLVERFVPERFFQREDAFAII